PGKAELVAVGIGQMEKALAPFGIARRRVWTETRRAEAGGERIYVGMIEDDATPPPPATPGRRGDQVEIALSRPKAREGSIIAAVDNLKAQHAIKAHRARHIVGCERHGTDILDHRHCSGRWGEPFTIELRLRQL